MSLKGFTIHIHKRAWTLGQNEDIDFDVEKNNFMVNATIIGVTNMMHEPSHLAVSASAIQLTRMDRDDVSQQFASKSREVCEKELGLIRTDITLHSIPAMGRLLPESCELCETFFEEQSYETKAGLQGALGAGDLLHGDRFNLQPQYRGHAIGLLALDSLITPTQSFHRDALVLSASGVRRGYWNELDVQDHATLEEFTSYWALMGIPKLKEQHVPGYMDRQRQIKDCKCFATLAC